MDVESFALIPRFSKVPTTLGMEVAMLNSDSYETSFLYKTPRKTWGDATMIVSEISWCFNHFSI